MDICALFFEGRGQVFDQVEGVAEVAARDEVVDTGFAEEERDFGVGGGVGAQGGEKGGAGGPVGARDVKKWAYVWGGSKLTGE